MPENFTPHQTAHYDSEVKRTIPYYENFHSETIGLIQTIRPGVKAWLDTGCGTGYLIEEAMGKFPDCTFYLADPSKQMLQICQERLADQKIHVIGQVPTLEIEKDREYDVITAIQCHHYMDYESRVKTTKHCYDLLNHDGLYITFENIRLDTDQGIQNGLARWASFQREQGREESEIEIHIDRFDKKYLPISISLHLEIMKQAGFKTVELLWMTHMQAGFYGIK